jgi:hypothetical protein
MSAASAGASTSRCSSNSVRFLRTHAELGRFHGSAERGRAIAATIGWKGGDLFPHFGMPALGA